MSYITLVIGGARSGKSRYAQELANKLAEATEVLYIATAEAGDDEMRERIARHKEERPSHWLTAEEPLEAANILRTADHPVVIIDCLSFFVVNHMLKNGGDPATCSADTWDGEAAEEAASDLMAAAVERPGNVIIVTNEVGMGLVPDTPLGRAFRDTAGRVNQTAAAAADNVVLMVAGIPVQVKE
jgi:adenosylcobinamide kinase/adenosylcobinamide-phosphate guanylyltransferase